MKKLRSPVFFLFILAAVKLSFAQPAEQLVKVIVAPEHTDWVYRTGENVKFNVTILRYGNPVEDVSISYTVGPERMAPEKSGTQVVKDGKLSIDGGTMHG
jgi:cephalosporin-C deacetylase